MRFEIGASRFEANCFREGGFGVRPYLPAGVLGLGVPLGLAQHHTESGVCAGHRGVKRDGRAVGNIKSQPVPDSLVGD
jgi:hypothetical protein